MVGSKAKQKKNQQKKRGKSENSLETKSVVSFKWFQFLPRAINVNENDSIVKSDFNVELCFWTD